MNVSLPKKSQGISEQDRSTSGELRKDAYTWPDLGVLLHVLSGREGSVKSPAKTLHAAEDLKHCSKLHL